MVHVNYDPYSFTELHSLLMCGSSDAMLHSAEWSLMFSESSGCYTSYFTFQIHRKFVHLVSNDLIYKAIFTDDVILILICDELFLTGMNFNFLNWKVFSNSLPLDSFAFYLFFYVFLASISRENFLSISRENFLLPSSLSFLVAMCFCLV